MSKILLTFCDWLGLDDDGVELSSEEFGEQWQNVMAKGNSIILFERMFHILDCNGDGSISRPRGDDIIMLLYYRSIVISKEEWEAHNFAMEIPPQHAKASFCAMAIKMKMGRFQRKRHN